jgi:hypothetical protein
MQAAVLVQCATQAPLGSQVCVWHSLALAHGAPMGLPQVPPLQRPAAHCALTVQGLPPGSAGTQAPLEQKVPAAQSLLAEQVVQTLPVQTPLWQTEALRQTPGSGWPHWPLLPQIPEEQWLAVVHGEPLGEPGVQVPAAQ